jgi:hypothetical protein
MLSKRGKDDARRAATLTVRIHQVLPAAANTTATAANF